MQGHEHEFSPFPVFIGVNVLHTMARQQYGRGLVELNHGDFGLPACPSAIHDDIGTVHERGR